MAARRDPPSAELAGAIQAAHGTVAKERLAAALRENLRRRKAQISGRRARAASQAPPDEANDSN